MTTLPSQSSTGDDSPDDSTPSVVPARLFVGLIVLISAEVFSGASIKVGLWMPWTWLITYWLYFAHFFFFTTLAVRTGRTSLWSLYLWGVLFGLYESWLTKVIWAGYGCDGIFALGSIGPYGYSEISMVFFFHPVMSFILPLAVACLLCPPLRRLFPDLAWFTGTSRGARVVQGYVVLSFVPVLAMNSGGPVHLALNLAFVLALLAVLFRMARRGLCLSDGRSIVGFGRKGFLALCVYLAFLYGVMYAYAHPEALPSVPVQLFTFVFYALAIAGLCLHRRREPQPNASLPVDKRELRLVKILFALILTLALAFSCLQGTPILHFPALAALAVWPPLGFLLTAVALVQGVRDRLAPKTDPRGQLAANGSSP